MCLRLIALVAIIVSLFAPVFRTMAAPALDTVRVTFQPFAINGGLFIADREGFFERQRIKVNWVPFNTLDQTIPVLIQGQLDVTYGLSPAFFNAVARGEPIRIVADKGHVAGRGNLASLFIRKDLASSVRSVADLKGRKIGLPGNFGGLAHFFMAKVLTSAGLTFNQVTPVFLPSAAVLAALQGGSVDAAWLGIPLDAQALQSGIGFKLVDVADVVPGEHVSFLIYGRNLLGEKRDLGVRFMVAYLEGVKRYSEGPTPRNVAIIAEYTKTEADVIRRSGWAPIYVDGFVDVDKARRYQDWLYEMELIGVRNPMSAVVDGYFAEQARGILGMAAR